ncbi:GntR family transcriptional regulator [Pseudofrankia inefficax]|uniref:Transcriptional regulator, GntR family n=1 Tax=Pseudofrankia inefficax (strain DSM 45817 / CECT 9037 / DDB 130130 / EuI1c) TaxID=298654 RepID=E3JAF5_PSEI1|nr:GntR family transcriptional regulator [Pseudofrankia inefficax]ADP81006.1 transcriptional regulator, GntR family [Pseudofrankia inefficax]
MRSLRPNASWIASLTTNTQDVGSLREAILRDVKRVILDGAAAPGSTVPVDEIAAHYQVSRIPVREALMSLVGEGLVTHRARGGYTVATLTPAEMREFYLVREALEAAALAAAVRRATASDDARALAAHEAMANAVTAGDSRGHHRESRRFHLALVNASGMARLGHMYESAWNVTEPARPMDYASRDAVEALVTDHERMLRAFIARDGEELLAASRVHHSRLQTFIAALPAEPGRFPA